MNLITRKEAQIAGLPKYTVGRICNKGHTPVERYVSTRGCVACGALYIRSPKRREYTLSIEFRIHNKEYRNRPEVKQRLVEQRSTEERMQRRRDRESTLETKRRIKEYCRAYQKEKKDVINAHSSWRRAQKELRTPIWADRKLIEEFYKEARRLTEETGVAYHVDHIIPLNGKLVSGLHVQNNLRVIPAIENLRKNNKLIEELL